MKNLKYCIFFVFWGVLLVSCVAYTSKSVSQLPATHAYGNEMSRAQVLITGAKSGGKTATKPLEISAQDLLRCMSHCNDVLVVNVLGRRFWEDARIKGSICAPLKDLEQEAKKWDKNQKIVVYCACTQCDASAKAYVLLKNMGFKKVLAYEGGIREWYRKGLPCEGPCDYEYLRRDDDDRSENKRK